mmetsp:Transcript_96828/g.278610  ORF Transcript_96828/g.278610 Transcript_96828/m.278610 type:complete len:206 (-) Transcript_96828:720-1337(-)
MSGDLHRLQANFRRLRRLEQGIDGRERRGAVDFLQQPSGADDPPSESEAECWQLGSAPHELHTSLVQILCLLVAVMEELGQTLWRMLQDILFALGLKGEDVQGAHSRLPNLFIWGVQVPGDDADTIGGEGLLAPLRVVPTVPKYPQRLAQHLDRVGDRLHGREAAISRRPRQEAQDPLDQVHIEEIFHASAGVHRDGRQGLQKVH